ncbi:tyrosine-type recombinase/integrase [Mesorhizobium tamadayense]|uniref:tyrosine-type recombinase/integrase n=1 Tax=Mesorhizobium tamadayense TaxID=425306 RepID=UPI00142D881C|nr:tyrosine-type recombinase/integrase [Mesorhizobium tamadayense]
MAVEYLGKGDYRQAQIGVADDELAADGIDVYDFEQARRAALTKIGALRSDDRALAEGPPPTVRMVVEAYVLSRDAHERELSEDGRLRGDARQRLTRHVLADEIADLPLKALTEEGLLSWRSRRSPGLSGATMRRIQNDFRAALNLAARQYRSRLPADLPTIVKHGLAVAGASAPVARDGAALPDADVRRIIESARVVDEDDGWDGDLLKLVAVLAASGARFSQITRMRVADVQVTHGRLMVPTSRKGRGAKKATHTGIRVGADIIELLRPSIAGKGGSDVLLQRWRHIQVKGTETEAPRWERVTRGPWSSASEITRPWAKIVAHSGLSADVVPYALRHSSIVRGLKAGLPIRLVASLHDTSSAVVERHYASSIIDAMDELSAAAIVPLIPQQESAAVVPLRPAEKSKLGAMTA